VTLPVVSQLQALKVFDAVGAHDAGYAGSSGAVEASVKALQSNIDDLPLVSAAVRALQVLCGSDDLNRAKAINAGGLDSMDAASELYAREGELSFRVGKLRSALAKMSDEEAFRLVSLCVGSIVWRARMTVPRSG
jgi:hypothetical protein